MTVAHLNSSWGIDGKLAGCAGPVLGRDLACPAKKRIRALVRLAEEHEGVCGKEEVPRGGFEDCDEPVGDMHAPQHEQIDTVIRFINDLSSTTIL